MVNFENNGSLKITSYCLLQLPKLCNDFKQSGQQMQLSSHFILFVSELALAKLTSGALFYIMSLMYMGECIHSVFASVILWR